MSATKTAPNTSAAGAAANNRKDIIIKSRTPCTNCISEINNTPIDNAKSIDVVMPMYNLMECSDNYSKTSGILWHYYRETLFLSDNGANAGFPADNNNTASFKFKTKIVSRIGNDGTKKTLKKVLLKIENQ